MFYWNFYCIVYAYSVMSKCVYVFNIDNSIKFSFEFDFFNDRIFMYCDCISNLYHFWWDLLFM